LENFDDIDTPPLNIPKYRTKCKECEGKYYGKWQRTSTKRAEYLKQYNEEKADHILARRHNSRAKKLGLPAELSANIVVTMREEQQGRCILSGTQDELDVEHAVPLSKGGGSTFENCYFINPYLNQYKGDKNMFEWIRGELSFVQRRFYNVFVPMMAERNGMTPEEYKDYVYAQYEADNKEEAING
jgi:5-methylcytosine-specific restriction endonuclease McrA